MKDSYKYTKYLVGLGIVLMGISYINFKKNNQFEIYPFFWWQLFTNPHKGSTPYSMNRIYEINDKDTIRLSNNGENLNKTVYNSLLNALTSKIENKDSTQEIKILLQSIGEQKTQHQNTTFLLIEETYNNPVELNLTNYEYTKKIIYSSAN